MKAKPFSVASVGVGITLGLSLVGELLRFKGILLLDFWAPLFAAGWLAWNLRNGKALPLSALSMSMLAFVGVGWASLLIHSTDMSLGSLVEAASYGVRWASLGLIGLLVLEEPAEVKRICLYEVLIFSVLLSVAGFIQLATVPDFTDYEILGWDPHQGRLLSTWFDPNFVGGWLAVACPLMLGVAWDSSRKQRWLWIAMLGITVLALLLTLSRSAYLAFIVGMGLFALLRSRTLLLAFIGVGLVATLALSPVRDRVLALVDSAQSVLTETYSLPDASARLRFGSWEEGWRLFEAAPLLGQGYNRYGDAALELGTLKDTEIHSANGSDASLLTVLASTGILGFVPFLLTHLLLLRGLWRDRKDSTALGLFCGVLGLFVHSVFVNSLLFPLLLAPLWIALGSSLHSRPNLR